MNFSVVVIGHPEQTQASYSAWRFCQAALLKEHQIVRVFFLHDATYQAALNNRLSADWQALAKHYQFDLDVCVTAAERRGLNADNLQTGFHARGLGQLVDASMAAERTITFR